MKVFLNNFEEDDSFFSEENISKLLEYINKINPDQIILESVFGDPLEYKHIKKLCIFCKENNIQVISVTNGFSDNFNLLDGLDVYYL